MGTILLFLLCFQACLSADDQKGGFLVTVPSTLLADSVENVCISLHNSSSPVQVSITLIGAFEGQTLSKASYIVDLEGCVELRVPPTTEQQARVVVRLQSADGSGLTSNSEVQVRLQTDPLIVLVSTDKPLYKPGQEVSFRVISLNHKLKPHNGKINKVWIETPTGIRVEQWTDVEVEEHGLVQLKFPLDKEPFFGKWKIKVQHNSSKIVEKTFTVKEFVPAIFEVVITPPKEILLDSTSISWNICAKYSYGELVQGNVHIEIKLEGSRTADQPNINNVVKLSSYTGCAEVTVAGLELGLADPLVRPAAVLLTATVTERATGVSHSTAARSQVHDRPFQLAFQCSQYFRPGLPYKGTVLLKTMDGRPKQAVGENIQVCVKVRYHNQLAMKLLHCWNYTTDFSSQVVFALPDINDPLNVQVISLVATAVDHPTRLYPGSADVMMLQPSVTQTVRPWFSPSHSYVDVWTRTTLACGTTHHVNVYYSVAAANQTTPTFFYLLESRGDLVSLRSVVPSAESVIHRNDVGARDARLVRGWRLPLEVTRFMAPASRLTVYYVRADGEVVAGSTNLAVDRCFQNKVRVRWTEPQLRPRQAAQLHIRAGPHSVCGVTATDRQLGFNSTEGPEADPAAAVWYAVLRFALPRTPRNHKLYCINKTPKGEELPPTYELRRKRSMSMPPRDFAEHVDAITAFDDSGIAVVSNLVLETRPCSKTVYPEDDGYYRRSFIPELRSFWMPRPLVANNMVLVTQQEPVSRMNDDSIQSLVRDHFPDTWIWSLAYTGREGEVIVNSSSPDSITSWETKVTCINEKDGLGMSRPTSVSVFLPFFVHIEAPYSIKMNEKVMIKIVVYNYMHHSLPVVLTVLKNDHLSVKPDSEMKLCLKPVSPHSVLVEVTPKVAGAANLIVQAKIQPFDGCDSPDLPPKSDTVVKQLAIKHEGYLEQKSHSSFICPSVHSDPSVSWNFSLPSEDNLVPGSARLQFSVVADLFGPALENLDSLVLLPMGCGEQNLARLAPNLYVLKYMNAIGSNNEQLKANAVKNIKKGYQRQLMFQRSDGSFSAFGDKDEEPSLWLTAAVIKTLSEAQDVVEVDPKVLNDAISWITKQQLENGCFPVIGELFHTPSAGNQEEGEGEGGEETTAGYSAQVLASLAGRVMLAPATRANAELCLATAARAAHPRPLATAALALARLGSARLAADASQRLRALAVTEHGLTHWGSPDGSLSDNIVTSSYAVLALTAIGGAENILTAGEAVRWISTHRNENGGFISTQDTVVALEALTAYMTLLPRVNRTELMVFTRGWPGQRVKTFRLSEDNKQVQQRLVTMDIPTTLETSVAGTGCVLIQSVVKYHVRRPGEGGHLELQVSAAAVSTVDPCGVQQLRVCTSAAVPVSMALLTVMTITGYSVDVAHLRQNTHPNVKKWEEEEDQVVFYLTNVSSRPVCLSVQLVRGYEVEDPLPAPVTVIDYYHPEISTSESYSFECSPIAPLDEPVQSDAPVTDRFDNFHNVDFELEVPEGNEGPEPVYATPPNTTTGGGNRWSNV